MNTFRKYRAFALIMMIKTLSGNSTMIDFELPSPSLPDNNFSSMDSLPDQTIDTGQGELDNAIFKQPFQAPMLLLQQMDHAKSPTHPSIDLPLLLPSVTDNSDIQPDMPTPALPVAPEDALSSVEPVLPSIEPTTPVQKKELSPKSWIIPSKTINQRTEIALAASVSKTGENHIMGSHCFEGMMLYFNVLNKKAEQSSLMVRVYSENDNSDIILAKKNIAQLKNQSPAIIGLLSDEIMREVAPTIEQQSLLALFPLCGSARLRAQPGRTSIYFRPAHKDELRVLLKYSLRILRKESFGVFYEDSVWGNDLKKELLETFKAANRTPDVEASYPEGSVNVTPAVKTIAQKGPSIIFCLAHARPAAVFIRRALNEGLYKSIFLGLSELIAIQNALKQLRGIEMITTSVVPDPMTSTLPLAQTFRDHMKSELPNRLISPYFFEGYIHGALFTEILSRINQPYTTMKVIKAFEQLAPMSLQGLPISFDKNARTLSSTIWINQGQGKPSISEKEVDES